MRVLAAPVLAALASGSAVVVQLVQMAFSTVPVALNMSTWDLVWQRRVNLLTYSEQFDNAIWVKTQATVTANAISAPDGLVTADKLIDTAVNTYHYLARTASFISGVTYSRSVYGKAGELGNFYIDFPSARFGSCNALIDLVSGSVQQPVNGVSAITSCGDGWYRVTLTATATVTGTGSVQIVLGTGSAYLGNGINGLYIWGAQLEPGDLSSTYTPTTSTALNEPGTVYKGAYGLGTISAVVDKPGDVQGLTLEMSGGDAARISLALDDSDMVQGTPLTLRTAIMDPATYTILDAPADWVGTLDTMVIVEDGQQAAIRVTAESNAVDLLRGTPQFYNDTDQRAINANDGSFRFVVDQIDKPLIWPAKSFFYQ